MSAEEESEMKVEATMKHVHTIIEGDFIATRWEGDLGQFIDFRLKLTPGIKTLPLIEMERVALREAGTKLSLILEAA
jgi:hypothetical protein